MVFQDRAPVGRVVVGLGEDRVRGPERVVLAEQAGVLVQVPEPELAGLAESMGPVPVIQGLEPELTAVGSLGRSAEVASSSS
ncbi:UNVERIFIED_CONTAM: hypothetical protein K2H54_054480 [Gekko kuhli]